MKTMNLIEAMRLYVAVAETEGFSTAARRQRTQQSTVSRAIAWLEKEYNATFFHRTTRTLKMTEEGRTYLVESRKILSEIDQLAMRMQKIQETPEGLLRISMPVAFGGRLIVGTLGEFKQKYPAITLEIHLEDREVNLIPEGYDVVIRVGPSDDSTVISRKLTTIHRGLYVSQNLQQKLGDIRSPHDLSRFPAVIFADRVPTRPKWILSRGNERRTVPISEFTVINHLDSLDSLMKQGLGVACIPHYFNQPYLKEKNIDKAVHVLSEWDVVHDLGQSSTVYLLYPKGEKTSAKARAFIDFLLEKATPKASARLRQPIDKQSQ
jgi:DNA-binding transcriptional LysR family regulator